MKKHYQPDLVDLNVPREPIPEEVRAMYLRPGELLSIQDKFPVAFQPLGTLEWHGRHNPIGCDSIKAEQLCIATAQRVGGVVMPPMFFSADAYRDCGKGMGMGMDAAAGLQLPGSFYIIDVGLFRDYVINACRNYLSRGFKLVALVAGHNPGLQQNMLDEVCYMMKIDDGREPVVFTMEYQVIPRGNPRRHSDHAGGYETSMMLHLAPGRVNMRANDNTAEPNLGVGVSFPVQEATAEEGRIRLEMQTEGLAKWAVEKFCALGAI